MTTDQVLEEAARTAASTDPAHDFSHVQRTIHNARNILDFEPEADEQVVLAALWLHELFNYPKGHPDSARSGDVCAERAAEVLARANFPSHKRVLVLDCIRNHAFSKGITPEHREGQIVQDADRLDAIGAIGIARCFATCAEMGRPFYDPVDPFGEHRPLNDKEWGIDHFGLKLLRLAEGMHTERAKMLAKERTEFLFHYLSQLAAEIGHTVTPGPFAPEQRRFP